MKRYIVARLLSVLLTFWSTLSSADELANPEPVTIEETGLPTLSILETTKDSGLKHQYATVSLARDLFVSGDAIPEFVIYLRDGPQSDFNGPTKPDNRGFPAFGKVIEGMGVVGRIANQDLSGTTFIVFLKGQILARPVVITKVYRK